MLHGIINVYKEKGYTSHDVVAKLRGIAGQKKIGHTGTLDPDAEGVLPVCLGQATRVCELLTDKDKVYRTVLLLGVSTDTQDITGTVLEQNDAGHLTEEQVRQTIRGFVGEYAQIPPMYSAVKVNGKKLYELAREGKTIERKPRQVVIRSISITSMELPRVEMQVECSKGTYIRTLCHDIGEALGVGGCMESLLRTRVGQFELADSVRLSGIQEAKEAGELESLLLPVDQVFLGYRSIQIRQSEEKRLQNGNVLLASEDRQDFRHREKVRVYDSAGRFAAVYEYRQKERQFKAVKMFLQSQT